MKHLRKRKSAALALAAAVLLSLSACGEKQPGREEVEQAIAAGTLTIEDALGRGWVDQAWVEDYYQANSMPAISKTEANAVGDFTTTTLSGEEFTKEQMGDVLFFAFIDPASDEAQGFYDELAAGYEDVQKNGADILVCTTRENGNEMFADAPFPVILWNDSLKTALGVNSGMIGDPEVPNTASWYANGSFLSTWSSGADAKELAESAAAFAEMAKEFSSGSGADNGGIAAVMG